VETHGNGVGMPSARIVGIGAAVGTAPRAVAPWSTKTSPPRPAASRVSGSVSFSVQFLELQAEGAVALRRGEAREAEPEERPALGGRGGGTGWQSFHSSMARQR
jgi:hypothetical protein